MKELNEIILPDELAYSKEHEWAKKENGVIRVGITDFAQDQLGDIVFAELPEEGAEFSSGDEFGTLESVKAVSEVYMPIGGTIKAVNSDLEEKPELVNQDPYGQGWLLEVTPSDPSELDSLMDKNGYFEMLKGDA
ncbi:glycine cleavage system protein GcvH [Desulfovermiculus halophilus]|jgi:glycine cleavage system H protein|uniref:glycine cleavage system protein GcvH n=1 Tax=Desulfovermiculus halophilus TaxID=339722 RepID=UPI00047F1BA0|nr:glycine cleavage system protein GcvH [Desulfovermiculus halophilus]